MLALPTLHPNHELGMFDGKWYRVWSRRIATSFLPLLKGGQWQHLYLCY